MKNLFIALAFLGLVSCATPLAPPLGGGGVVSQTVGTEYAVPHPSATTGVHVRLMRGLGNESWSEGVDQIAAMAAKIPGVTMVRVYNYYQTQDIADEVNAEPPSVKEVIGGFSCGANASPVVGAGIRRVVQQIAVIQASLWCGGTPLTPNVLRAQETYNDNCAETFGLGCKKLDVGPGFEPSRLTLILRPDCHPCADVDPDAQRDVLSAIRSVTNAKTVLTRRAITPGVVNHIVLYRGQSLH